jgi:prevent-host-death family protein
MTTVKMHEAKTHLSSLVARAVGGEDIVIARGDLPQVRLVPVEEKPKPKRVFGAMKGQFAIDERFFEPLPEEELAAWEGK